MPSLKKSKGRATLKPPKKRTPKADVDDLNIGMLGDDNITEIMNYLTGDPFQYLADIDFMLKGLASDRVSILMHTHIMCLLTAHHYDAHWDGISCIYEQTSCYLNRQGVHLPDPIESTREAGVRHYEHFHLHRSIRPVYFAIRVDEFSDLYNIYSDVTTNSKVKTRYADAMFRKYKDIVERLGLTFRTFGFFDGRDGKCQPYYLVSLEFRKEPSSLFFFLEKIHYARARLPSNMELGSAFPSVASNMQRAKAVVELRDSPGADLLSSLMFNREYAGIYYLVFARCDCRQWTKRSFYFNRRVQQLMHVDHLNTGIVDMLIHESMKHESPFYEECRRRLGDEELKSVPQLLSATLIAKTESECHDSVIRVTLPTTQHYTASEIAISCEYNQLPEQSRSLDCISAERSFRLDFGASPILHKSIDQFSVDDRWDTLHARSVSQCKSDVIEGNIVTVPLMAMAVQQIGMYFPNALLVNTLAGYHLDRISNDTRMDARNKFYFGVPSITVSGHRSTPLNYFGTIQYTKLASNMENHCSSTYNMLSGSVEFMRFASYRHGAMGFKDLVSVYDKFIDSTSCETYSWFDLHPRITRHFARCEAYALKKLQESSFDVYSAHDALLLEGIA
jgi:hypothetical protein